MKADRYQLLRDIVATSSLPTEKTFSQILELLGDLLKERDALRRQLFSAVAEIEVWSLYAPQHVRELQDIDAVLERHRAALADGEAQS